MSLSNNSGYVEEDIYIDWRGQIFQNRYIFLLVMYMIYIHIIYVYTIVYKHLCI